MNKQGNLFTGDHLLGTSISDYDGTEESGAHFSPCGKYRYRLWRQWDKTKRSLVFIGLNPSTADAVQNDPTVERLERRARTMGAGGLTVCNIFAFRATDPKDMKKAEDPVGPLNNDEIAGSVVDSFMTLCGWGAHGSYRERGKDVLVMLRLMKPPLDLRCLGVTKDGQPKHPLYIGYDVNPKRFAS